MPQVVTFAQIPRVLVKASCFSSRCRSRGWIPKEGAAAPSFWSFRKGVQGETQPKGFPLGLSLGATRFSRREKWVASAQPSSWLSPTAAGRQARPKRCHKNPPGQSKQTAAVPAIPVHSSDTPAGSSLLLRQPPAVSALSFFAIEKGFHGIAYSLFLLTSTNGYANIIIPKRTCQLFRK